MYGIAAITAKNGWAMAIAGALIVMAGLAVLAMVIAQLKRLADYIEYRGKDKSAADAVPQVAVKTSSFDIDEIKARYQLLAEQLGDTFDLTRLYQLAADSGFPHVHLSIRTLREAGMLVPVDTGVFSWKK